jgi:type IV secretion system protein VirD4
LRYFGQKKNESKTAKYASFAKGAFAVWQALEQINAARRAREAEVRALAQEVRVEQSLIEAAEVRREMLKEEASGKLGDSRLGTLEDAGDLGMLDPQGLFLGALDGRPIFYNGTGHLLNYGPTQTGKGRDIALPNLAHIANRSIVVSDIKNGENAYASAAYRKQVLKQRTIALNPHELLGQGSFRFNPFSRIIERAGQGRSVATDCLQMCMSIVPPIKGSDAWVAHGAQQLLATWLEYQARYKPDRCTLSNMWRFALGGEMEETLEAITKCGNDALEGLATSALEIKRSEDQFNAYSGELRTALWNFRPGEPLAEITETSDFDPASLRHEPTTVYLMTEEAQALGSSRWIALTISAILETCANTRGPVRTLFMVDEIANLPYMAVLPKALTLYAGLGVQLWGLCQGREALKAAGYGDEVIRSYEQQAGVLHMWGVEDPTMLRDIELWSGKKTVAIRGVNNSGGQVSSASFGISEHARPVLQTEDIRAVFHGRQIIRMMGSHLFVADRVPWFTVPRWSAGLRDVRQLHHNADALPATSPTRAKLPATRLLEHHQGEPE